MLYAIGAIAVLVIVVLVTNKNKCEGNLFRTESKVHHAVFSMPADKAWEVESVETVVADMANYQPLPIEKMNVAKQVAAVDTASANH